MVEYLGPTHQQVLLSIFKWRPIPTRVANSTPIQRYRHCRHPHQKMHWLIPKACSWNGEKASGLQKMTPVEQNKATTTYCHSYKKSDCNTRGLYAHPKVSLSPSLNAGWLVLPKTCPRNGDIMCENKVTTPLTIFTKNWNATQVRRCRALLRQTIQETLCKHHEFSVNLT